MIGSLLCIGYVVVTIIVLGALIAWVRSDAKRRSRHRDHDQNRPRNLIGSLANGWRRKVGCVLLMLAISEWHQLGTSRDKLVHNGVMKSEAITLTVIAPLLIFWPRRKQNEAVNSPAEKI